ncbi:MAG: hypothetical protein E6R07_06485 [Nevskiaceae bacterium]|nr:MAG: hypothetical protein E6R07_06485 [Nevskiaceae bacterium]
MKLTTALLAAALTFSSAAAFADDPRGVINDEPSATAMAADLLIVRPVSLVATVIGAGLFIAQLPLSIVMGVPPAEPAKKLVAEPAAFTFRRPLGHMD